ncbi:hypothetical protein AAG906_017366 [Vitis piasezkii]
MGHLVTPSFGFVVGDGKKVRFWKDKWCGTTPLCEDFPSLFALATSKEAWVNEVRTAAGERGGSWSPRFNRPFNDWELEEVERLVCCLDGKKVSVDEEDRVSQLISILHHHAKLGFIMPKEEILRYFEKLYASPSEESWRVEALDWSPISGESASRLESPFTKKEISKAIFQLDRDKAPRPDGFTIRPYHCSVSRLSGCDQGGSSESVCRVSQERDYQSKH